LEELVIPYLQRLSSEPYLNDGYYVAVDAVSHARRLVIINAVVRV
jgi:hypothetical protein